MPVEIDEPAERLAHLRLHNGTIWRWNRPLVGFDADGRAHLRIEHRPMAAGPTLGDMMANLAFAIGLVAALAARPPGARLGCRSTPRGLNFYGRRGTDSTRGWSGWTASRSGRRTAAGLLPLARSGLARLRVAPALEPGRGWT